MSKLNRRLLAILMLLLAAVALTIIVKAQDRAQAQEAQQQVASKLEAIDKQSAPPAAELAEAQENPWQDESPMKYMGEFRITHYCACKECCGKDESDPWYGITATGTVATEGRTIAVDPDVIPYGSRVAVFYDDGRICHYIAEDCGGAVDGLEVDVFIADHDRAWNLGVKFGSVYIVNKE